MIPQDWDSFCKYNYRFSNWAGIHSTKANIYSQPETVEQVIDIVKYAYDRGQNLTVVGTGHSPNTLCIGSKWMINLSHLNHISGLTSTNKDYADVTVEAGVDSYHLNQYLDKHGYCLQNLPSINEPSIAGMISTGTHGSSAYHGLISSQVVNITFVNGRGELVFVDSETDPEVFKALLLSLGQIGIIVKLTVRVVPKFNLKVTQEIISFDKLIAMWDYIWISQEYIKVWWYPYTGKCVLWRGSRTQDELTKSEKKKRPLLSNKCWRFFYEAALFVSTKFAGWLTPYVERFIFRSQFRNLGGIGECEPEVITSMDGFTLDCLFSQYVDEWGCSMVDGPTVLKDLDKIIYQGQQSGKFYIHSPMEIRCSNTTLPTTMTANYAERDDVTKGSIYGNIVRPLLDNSFTLAPYTPAGDVSNEQLTLYINATIYRPFRSNSKIYEWFSRFEKIMMEVHGKPHWAKNFIGSEDLSMGKFKDGQRFKDNECIGLGKFFTEKYSKELTQFKEIKNEQDPKNVFVSNEEWMTRNGLIRS